MIAIYVDMLKGEMVMERKCDECDMPEWIKSKNTSIKDGTGSCYMCFQVRDRWAKQIDEDFEKELAHDADRENAKEMEQELKDRRGYENN